MSLVRVVDNYHARAYGPPPGTVPREERTAAAARPVVRTAAEQLVQWIPSEMLAFYVPVVVPFADATVLWVIYGISLVLTPFIVLVLARERFAARKQRGQAFRVPLFPMAAGFVAFAVWAAALPGSVVMRTNVVPGAVMTLAIVLVTFVLSLAERAVELASMP